MKKSRPVVKKGVRPVIYFRTSLQVVGGGITPGGAVFSQEIITDLNIDDNSLTLVSCDMQIGNDLVWFYFKNGIEIVVARDMMEKIEYI